MTEPHPLIVLAIARRMANGLSLRAYGAEDRTQDDPFTCHAKDADQRDKWRASMERQGFTVEVMS